MNAIKQRSNDKKFPVDLLTCSTTCCLFYNVLWTFVVNLSFVVRRVVQEIDNKSKLVESER